MNNDQNTLEFKDTLRKVIDEKLSGSVFERKGGESFLKAVVAEGQYHELQTLDKPGEVYAKCTYGDWMRTRSVGAGETLAGVRKMLEHDFENHTSLRNRVREVRRLQRDPGRSIPQPATDRRGQSD